MLVNLPTSANIFVPNIKRSIYTVIDADEDGFVTLMDKQGTTRQDLKLPDETENDKIINGRIREWISGGREMTVTVVEALKIEKIAEVSSKSK